MRMKRAMKHNQNNSSRRKIKCDSKRTNQLEFRMNSLPDVEMKKSDDAQMKNRTMQLKYDENIERLME